MPAARSLSTRSSRSTPYSTADSLTSRDAEGDTDADFEYSPVTSPEPSEASTVKARVPSPPPASVRTRATSKKKGKDLPKPRLASVTIDGFELKPTAAFDTFWWWLWERKRMDDKRRRGDPYPWTDDPVLHQYYFCNSYRVMDKVSQYLVTDVIEKGSQDPTEIVFRVLLFTSFNRISTWEHLTTSLGELRWSTYSPDAYEDALGALYDAREKIYTSAYIKPAPHFGSSEAYKNHLRLLENMMENEMPSKLLGAPTMADVYEYIVSFPGMGDFTTYQLMLNLSYSPVLHFHPNDFVMTGPGSISGLVKLFGQRMRSRIVDKRDKPFAIAALRWLVDTQDEHFARLGLDFAGLGPEGLKLDLSDIEHAVCEVDKYCRAAMPSIKGVSERRQMKRSYTPSGTPLPPTPALPKAWADPRRLVPRIRPGPLYVEKRYEIKKIGAHRIVEIEEGEEDSVRATYKGEMEFLVFWVGYHDKDASWLLERTLAQDAPVILKEYMDEAGLGVKKARTSKVEKGRRKSK